MTRLYQPMARLALLLGEKQFAAMCLRVELEMTLRRYGRRNRTKYFSVLQEWRCRGFLTSRESRQLQKAYTRFSKAIHGRQVSKAPIVKGLRDMAVLDRAVSQRKEVAA